MSNIQGFLVTTHYSNIPIAASGPWGLRPGGLRRLKKGNSYTIELKAYPVNRDTTVRALAVCNHILSSLLNPPSP